MSLLRYRNLIEVKRLNRNSVRVKCRLRKMQLWWPMVIRHSFRHCTLTPLDWSESEILENGSSGSRLIRVERMNYWDTENQRAMPSKSVKITFRSYDLPTELKIYNVLTKLDLFIPRPMFCKNCCKYGHSVKFCKTGKVCSNCTMSDHVENCVNELKCNYCRIESKHVTNSESCPEKSIQAEVKKVMVTEKNPFSEANKEVRKKITENNQKKKMGGKFYHA